MCEVCDWKAERHLNILKKLSTLVDFNLGFVFVLNCVASLTHIQLITARMAKSVQMYWFFDWSVWDEVTFFSHCYMRVWNVFKTLILRFRNEALLSTEIRDSHKAQEVFHYSITVPDNKATSRVNGSRVRGQITSSTSKTKSQNDWFTHCMAHKG